MKEVITQAAQGDVLFRRVKTIPEGFVKQTKREKVIVSHSETGHHHAIEHDHLELWEKPSKDSLVCYLQMSETCDFTKNYFDVEHLRSYDTHETLRLKTNPGDIWEVRRQREHTPEGWRRVQD